VRVDVLTREYPPDVYGGAGVHVAELVRVLRELPADPSGPPLDVRVRCFGDPRDEAGTTGYPDPGDLAGANAALRTLGVDLRMAMDVGTGSPACDVVHSHTWYANLAGHVAGLLHGVPHVVTAHSLEPLRPWKAEQLGGGYALSSWAERTAFEAAAAVVAVSAGMRKDILRAYPDVDPARVHVVHNGIDAQAWTRDDDAAASDAVRGLGMDPDRPSIVFVGRITRQKGLPHLLRAAAQLPPQVQLVLVAGAPDTPEIAAEVAQLVEDLRTTREGVVLIERMLPRTDVVRLLSAATVFVCPSVYEPLGIVNLEAMACGAAVVGTATGGIPEVVVDGETGWLVPIEQVQDGTGTPVDPARYEADLAAALTEATADPDEARRRGRAGRERAVEHFAWPAIAERTLEVYRAALS
jgi:alpha-maltose-1-phosphate synthase